MVTYMLYQDLGRCVHCFTCMVACKNANELPEGKQRIINKEFGPFEVDGRKRVISLNILDFSDKCDFEEDLPELVAKGGKPACVTMCPTESMKFGTLEDFGRDCAKEGIKMLVLKRAEA